MEDWLKRQRRPRQNSIQSFYCYLTLGRWRHLVLSRQIVEKTGGEKHWVLREIKGMDGDPHSLFYHSIILSGWSWSQLDDKKWSRSSQMHCGQKPAEYPRPRREIESKTRHDSSFTFTFPPTTGGAPTGTNFLTASLLLTDYWWKEYTRKYSNPTSDLRSVWRSYLVRLMICLRDDVSILYFERRQKCLTEPYFPQGWRRKGILGGGTRKFKK